MKTVKEKKNRTMGEKLPVKLKDKKDKLKKGAKPKKKTREKETGKALAEQSRREVPKKRIDFGESFRSLRQFFSGVWQELRKVHWPNRRVITIYTTVVLVVVAIVAIIIWVADSIFSKILGLIIK